MVPSADLEKGVIANDRAVCLQVIDRMHMTDMTICYGMTETSPVSFQSSPQDSIEQRVSTIGSVHPHIEAKVVDPATGYVVPRNHPGEIPQLLYSSACAASRLRVHRPLLMLCSVVCSKIVQPSDSDVWKTKRKHFGRAVG